MRSQHWLKSALALPGLDVAGREALVDAVAQAVAQTSDVSKRAAAAAFQSALAVDGWSLGSGVAIPHAELAGVAEPIVVLVVSRAPLKLLSIDNRAPDVFFFILAPPEDPEGHLLLLARLARLAQSRTLLEALRKSRTSEEMVSLVRAAELRHTPAVVPSAVSEVPAPPNAAFVMIVIAVAGEKAGDALLVELLDRELGDATIVEAQSLREATTREVPLFAGFHDIFGDPGGRRVILVDAPAHQADEIVAVVQRIADERSARDVRLSVLPVHRRWQLARGSEEEPGGH